MLRAIAVDSQADDPVERYLGRGRSVHTANEIGRDAVDAECHKAFVRESLKLAVVHRTHSPDVVSIDAVLAQLDQFIHRHVL